MVSAATSFVLGDDLRGGGRGEAVVGTEEDVAAWRGLPNEGDGDFGPELSNQRQGERSAMVGVEGVATTCTSAGEETARQAMTCAGITAVRAAARRAHGGIAMR